MARTNEKLFAAMSGVKLDVGCGRNKQPGCIGIDFVKLPGVDIVHDLQMFPWPVPDHVCTMIVMSHVWEHIEPKYRGRLMEELWRVIRYDGQLFIAAPYAGTFLAHAHPEHYMCPNEATFTFYDPNYPLYYSGSYGLAKPWKIIRNDANYAGCIEVIMEPYKDKKGHVCLPKELESKIKSLSD
jgi:predicted SAM-dependent methyltransferase